MKNGGSLWIIGRNFLKAKRAKMSKNYIPEDIVDKICAKKEQRIAELESKLTNIKSAWINLTEYEACDTMVITLESYEKLQAAIEGKGC
jgi:uncharacterized protein YgiM (DUF1202 family)